MTRVADVFSPVLSKNMKVINLENSLQRSLIDFKELLVDFEKLHIESDNYKQQAIEQKEKCERKCCTGADAMRKEVEAKEYIIQAAASSLTRLNETKNFSIIDEIFKILFGEATSVTPPSQKGLKNMEFLKTEVSPKNATFDEDINFKDESVSEIEGTPTGRTSPIIQMKKLKSSNSTAASDFRDKKKCPDTWPTPENKSLKLSFSTPTRGKGSRLRQSRLNIVKVKESNIIDITCSPEFNGGSRRNDNDTQTLIKKESLDNEDTILPSPTSGPTNFTLFKSKESPMKFKKPLSLKSKTEAVCKTRYKIDPNHKLQVEPTLDQLVNIKTEKFSQNIENRIIEDVNVKMNDSVTYTQDNSINILNPKRLPINQLKKSPVKVEHHEESTFCDTQASISLLQHVNNLTDMHKGKLSSPTKRALAENINVVNQAEDDLQSSMSLLQRETKVIKSENVKSLQAIVYGTLDTGTLDAQTYPNGVFFECLALRKIPELVPVVYKEELPRSRAERRLLPGWACEKCVNFFGELYKDDPEMMAKKINECSHHRGMQNPERPKTPPNYWNPRWEVPQDTEEFNRKNNVNF